MKFSNKREFVEGCISLAEIIEEFILFTNIEDEIKLQYLKALDIYRDKILYMVDTMDMSLIRNSKLKVYKAGGNPYE